MMAKTNVGVDTGVAGERDPRSEKERTAAWRKIRKEATLEPPPRVQASSRDVDAAVKYIRKEKRGAPGYTASWTIRNFGPPEKDPTNSYVRRATTEGMGGAEGCQSSKTGTA